MHIARQIVSPFLCALALCAIAPLARGQTAPPDTVQQPPANAPAKPRKPPAASAPAPTAPAPSTPPPPAVVPPAPPAPAAPAPTAPAAPADPSAPSEPPEAPATPPCEVEPCPAPLPDSTAVPLTAPAPTTYPPAPYYPQPLPVEAAPGADSTSQPLEYGPGPVLSGRPARLNRPGAREHDGFFLRLTIGAGAGFASYSESVDGQRTETVETGGLAGQLEAAVGGRVIGNLIVHGNLLLGGVGGARKTVSGVRDASNKISSSFSLLGGGVTYYFMPYNVYVSGMMGAGYMDETRDDELSVESGTGFGGALMLGKEWWVGQRAEWGMGAALRGTLLSAPVTIAGVESRMRGSHITIVVSVTFN